MKRTLSLTGLLLTLAGGAFAQVQPVPPLMNFQGRLAKPDGTALADGTYSITFSLWSAASGGTQVWTETDSVTARNGAFAVLLGKTTALTDSVFAAPVYLQIKVGAAAALTPRQPLVSVAHAFKADTVPDGSLTASKFASNIFNPLAWLLSGNSGVTSGFLGTTDNQPLAFRTSNTERMRISVAGSVGIGTTTPADGLSVVGGLHVDFNDQFGVSNGRSTLLFGSAGTGEGIGSDRNPTSVTHYGLQFYTGGNLEMSLTNSGNLGVGVSNPIQKLEVNGNILSNGGDFILKGRGGGFGNAGNSARALVDAGDAANGLYGGGLVVNFENDYGRVLIQSPLDVGGALVANNGTDSGQLANGTYGVYGTSTSAYAIRGEISGGADTGGWAGVSGKDNTSGNFGQLGTKTNGVAGRSVVSGGDGLYGEATNSNGEAGVRGIYTPNGNYGLLGVAGAGVFGSSPVGSAPGVAGYNTAGGNGVYGSGSGYGVFAAGNLGYTGSLTHVSDARYKTQIRTLDNALDAVLNLRGVSYEWRRDEFPQMNFGQGRQNGFIAQEMETILPELVLKDKDGFRSVDYVQVVPVLVEAMKTQQKQIEELKSQLKQRDEQQKDIADLKKQLAALLAAMKAQKADAPQR